MDKNKELLDQAIDIIHDLLKGGYHEGECDNKGMESDEACGLHLEAARNRSKRADEFLKQFPQ
jgi:hypothetical protein